MSWVIERGGWTYSPRGWRPGTSEGKKFPTQGEAQEAMDELIRQGLAQLGGKTVIREIE